MNAFSINTKLTSLSLSIAVLSIAVLSIAPATFAAPPSSTLAPPLNLADQPLFISGSVDPNVMILMDDSGSMDWEVMTKAEFLAECYQKNHPANPGESDCGPTARQVGEWKGYAGGGVRYFEYMFNMGDHAYTTGCTNGERQVVEMCTSATPSSLASEPDWRVYSSAMNVIYYDPGSSYEPWNFGGLPNANFAAARSDPQPGSDGYNMTKNLDGIQYIVWHDTHGFAGQAPNRGADIDRAVCGDSAAATTVCGTVDLWDEYTEYTVYADKVVWTDRGWLVGADGTLTRTMGAAGVLTGALEDPFGRTLAEIKQNVANWFQYYRRRSFVAKGAVVSVVRNPDYKFRLGLATINESNLNGDGRFVAVPSASETNYSSHNNEMLSTLLNYDWPAAGTPLRRALERAGNYYSNAIADKTDPVTHACQRNYSLLFTDGFWNGGSPSSSIGDVDGDGKSAKVSDVARYYYNSDLRADLDNNVVPLPSDPRTDQHMNTFTIAFGVEGWLFDSAPEAGVMSWPDKKTTATGVEDFTPAVAGNWGNPSSSDLIAKVDDLWHAAYNAAGGFVSANNKESLTDGINTIFSTINPQIGASAAVTTTTGTLTADTKVYRVQFNSRNWSGDVIAQELTDDGDYADVVWNATEIFEDRAWGDRDLFSYNTSTKKGVRFAWPAAGYDAALNTEISNVQAQLLLKHAPYSVSTTDATEKAANNAYGSLLTNYIKGDRSREEANVSATDTGTTFRDRDSVLGDIVNSSPVYVRPPAALYPEDIESILYSIFKTQQRNRPGVVYVGANDGMLHALHGETGEELFGYVPGKVYDNIAGLGQSPYQHRYSVDGGPIIVDAYTTVDSSNGWYSILVGGLNAGGQGIYALNVTDPSAWTAATPDLSKLVLWEFTDENDSNLGYTYSQPLIAKMHNGKWAAIFGNGYNNTVDDGRVGNGSSILYIVDLATGQVMTSFDPGAKDSTTPNGMSSPFLVDLDNDYVVDYIYAGDLWGNLWMFDVTAGSAGQWKTGHGGDAVFQAKSPSTGNPPQSITTRPAVARHPSGIGVLVFFGTGSYFQSTDNSVTAQNTQTFYGIWDHLTDGDGRRDFPIERADLLQQTITFQGGSDLEGGGSALVRVTSRNDIDYDQESNNDPVHRGWYLDLEYSSQNKGERVIYEAVARNGRVLFTTYEPSEDVCDAGAGFSWIMMLSQSDGKPLLANPPFDLNADGVIDDEDYLRGDYDTNEASSGYRDRCTTADCDRGPTPTPVCMSGDGSDVCLTNSEAVRVSGGDTATGRQSWRVIEGTNSGMCGYGSP